jgi:hypothetical protein
MKNFESHQRAVLQVGADHGNVRFLPLQFPKYLSGSSGESMNLELLTVLLEGSFDELAGHTARFGYNHPNSVRWAQNGSIKEATRNALGRSVH